MTVQLPLSAAQQRIWFLHQLRPDDPAYNIVTAVELVGPAAPAALAAAVHGIMARHEILRVRFGLRGTRPVQLPAPAAGLALPRLVDLTGVAADRREEQLSRLLRAAAARPFDLGAGPVADWSLLRLAPDRHVLVFVVHHVVFDGGSLWVACREIEQRYAASRAGRPVRQPAADRARPPQPDVDAADLAFWRARLAGAPARLRVLPTAGVAHRQPGRETAGDDPPALAAAGNVTVPLGEQRTEELRAFARRLRGTPFMTLLAVFAGLLVRYTGQPDLVVGTPVSTRDTDASRSEIGLFLNMLPLRLDLAGDPSLRESVPRVREVVLDAFAHRAVPFERLVDDLRPPRALEYPPLFQVVFAYQESPAPPRLPGLRTRLLPVDAAAAKYDLTVIATDTGDDLEITVQADPTTDPSAPQLFAANFDVLLAGALHDPARALSRLPLLGPVPVRPPAGGAPPPPQPVSEPAPGGPPVPPRTARERAVAAAWCATLRVAEVGVHDSFFDLGGSSLSLLDLHARLRTEVSAALTLADLFRFPTVASLAGYLDGDGSATTSVGAAAARGARRRAAAAGRRGGGEGA